MVQSSDHSVVANQSPVANIDSALVLDGAASINEHVLANMDIFPAISIKWRQQCQTPIDLAASQFGKKVLHLLWRMISIVQLHRHL